MGKYLGFDWITTTATFPIALNPQHLASDESNMIDFSCLRSLL